MTERQRLFDWFVFWVGKGTELKDLSLQTKAELEELAIVLASDLEKSKTAGRPEGEGGPHPSTVWRRKKRKAA